jgi:hypothetical protein
MDTAYSAGVKLLLDYALNQPGSGAKAAAQVLLSTYNSYNYHVALVDLCNLDDPGYKAALDVIRGRAETLREPHTIIENGYELFERLEDIWRPLQTQYRYANKYVDREVIRWKCPYCGATESGYVEGPFPGRYEGRPICKSWADSHPDLEPAVMEPQS